MSTLFIAASLLLGLCGVIVGFCSDDVNGYFRPTLFLTLETTITFLFLLLVALLYANDHVHIAAIMVASYGLWMVTVALLNVKLSEEFETEDPTTQAKIAVALQWLSLLSAIFHWLAKPTSTPTSASQVTNEPDVLAAGVDTPSEVQVNAGAQVGSVSRIGIYGRQEKGRGEERIPLTFM